MEQSARPEFGRAPQDALQGEELADRTRASEETCRWYYCCRSCIGKASNEISIIPDTSVPHRGEHEAPQDKHTNLDRTEMEQQMKCLEDKLRSEMNARFEGIEKRLHFLEENRRDLSRMVSAQVFHQKEEEYQKLKKEKEVLEQRLHHILAKAMESHKFSENLNDPCRLSAVLEMYDRLRTHEWEKAKCAARLSGFSMTYKDGGTIIKAVFTKCEGMLSQRMDQIRKLLECPVLKETTTQQLSLELAQDIKNHLKNLYFKLGEDFYQSLSLLTLWKPFWLRNSSLYTLLMPIFTLSLEGHLWFPYWTMRGTQLLPCVTWNTVKGRGQKCSKEGVRGGSCPRAPR
ncbi:uncharacterized protein LOC102445507 isoform X3 [Pelodiscus sinensis]|uniref:uncharacterized protein LOC102445507 isoform X3 n=1 Tax=Pelodiscus sinensis TaxID=13735 RepID=UPI003F6CC396